MSPTPVAMRAMVFDGAGRPLRLEQRPVPTRSSGQLLLRVLACGICRTDLHLIDGEVAIGHPPRILGHQIVGVVDGSERRVGVPWVGWTCGACERCLDGHENVCPNARFTGCDIDGGMAEYTVADERFTHVSSCPLERANEALADLRAGSFSGAAVLVP